MKKFVFVVPALDSPRTIKRIEEFISEGYAVKVYAINRGNDLCNSNLSFEYEEIESFPNSTPYLKRIPILRKAIGDVVEKEGKDSIYYVFGSYLGILFSICWPRHNYIYEEGDLAHTYISNRFLRLLLEKLDLRVIRKSRLTVFTSEGFLRYHYGKDVPNNTIVVSNRIDNKVLNYERNIRIPTSLEHLSIGFVGKPRFKSVFNFVTVFCKNYPEFQFHFFGGPVLKEFEPLKEYSNCFFHGSFITPDDLNDIYSKLDLVLSTYDVEFANVRYAEPNKLYEAIYFGTPIIVSKGTFLAEKTEELGVGYAIDPLNEEEVTNFIKGLSIKDVLSKISKTEAFPTSYCVNSNKCLFDIIESIKL